VNEKNENIFSQMKTEEGWGEPFNIENKVYFLFQPQKSG
jgi:transcription initiation factor IIF auxiliary subunit